MLTPKEVAAAKLRIFGEQCKSLEEQLDNGLRNGCTFITILDFYPEEVVKKVKERYERYGWEVSIAMSANWTFRPKEEK